MKPVQNVAVTRRKFVEWWAAIGARALGARLLGRMGLGASVLASAGCSPGKESTEVGTERRHDSALHRAIRRHFDYLSIDDAVIEAFVEDLVRSQGPWSSETSPRPFTRFLASTDFFQKGADESRPLSYVAFYDPYVSTCYNPFADSV